MVAGSVSVPFTENLMDVPHMVKLCKQHTSGPLQPDEHAPKVSSAHAPHAETPASAQGTASALKDCSEFAMQNSAGGVQEKAERCNTDVIVVCRRGNDSQHVVHKLRSFGFTSAVDLIGGLSAWSQQLDPSFPDY